MAPGDQTITERLYYRHSYSYEPTAIAIVIVNLDNMRILPALSVGIGFKYGNRGFWNA